MATLNEVGLYLKAFVKINISYFTFFNVSMAGRIHSLGITDV